MAGSQCLTLRDANEYERYDVVVCLMVHLVLFYSTGRVMLQVESAFMMGFSLGRVGL